MFDMLTPCSNCPFLKKGGIRLRPARVREIADPYSGIFPCHKTVTHDDEDGEQIITGKEQYCAGKLLFNMKVGHFDQMMRIGERTGWKPDDMIGYDLVFDSLRSMLATNRKSYK